MDHSRIHSACSSIISQRPSLKSPSKTAAPITPLFPYPDLFFPTATTTIGHYTIQLHLLIICLQTKTNSTKAEALSVLLIPGPRHTWLAFNKHVMNINDESEAQRG